MIPNQFVIGNPDVTHEVVDKDGKSKFVVKGVDILVWMDSLEKRVVDMRKSLAAAGGIIFKSPEEMPDITLVKDNKKTEIKLFEDNKRLREIMIALKDPEKQKLKIYEFIEFMIYNILASKPDGKNRIKADRRKQIIDNTLKKLREEEIKKEVNDKTDKEILETPDEELTEMGRKRKKKLGEEDKQ